MVGIAIQLYTLRSLDEAVPDLVRRVSGTAFEGVELAGLGGSTPDEVAAALAGTGTAVVGAHVGIESLETGLDEARAAYSRIGCDTLVVPRLDPVCFADAAAVGDAASRLNDVARRLAGADIRLCYHNHDHEFVPVDGAPALDRLAGSLGDDVGIEFDVGWAVAAGRDPVEVLDRLAGRVPLVHLKDVDAAGTPVELGAGVVDLEACAGAARDAGADWLVYEHDDPEDPGSSLEHGARTLADLRDAVVR